MADATDLLFLIQLIVFVGLAGAKMYNIFSNLGFYNMRLAFLSFIGGVLAWGIGFIVSLTSVTDLMMQQVFKLEILMFVMFVLFFIVELFMWVGNAANVAVKPNNSLAEKMKM